MASSGQRTNPQHALIDIEGQFFRYLVPSVPKLIDTDIMATVRIGKWFETLRGHFKTNSFRCGENIVSMLYFVEEK